MGGKVARVHISAPATGDLHHAPTLELGQTAGWPQVTVLSRMANLKPWLLSLIILGAILCTCYQYVFSFTLLHNQYRALVGR